MGTTPPIHVVAAVLTDRLGRVLLQRRKSDSHQGDLWEFPGGKVLPGESREQALRRELREELDIGVQFARPLIRIGHNYPELSIDLDLWEVIRFGGMLRPRESQPLRWTRPEELHSFAMPAADRALINAVRLPDVCLITGDEPLDRDHFLRRLEQRVAEGVKLVQLRIQRQESALRWLTLNAAELCQSHGAWLVLNGNPQQAMDWDAHGVHLNRKRLMQYTRRPVSKDLWLSAACHNLRELQRAHSLGVDFLFVSPVQSSLSHPGSPTIGFDGLQWYCKAANCPVYALGGMSHDDIDRVREVGGQGVAGISGFW